MRSYAEGIEESVGPGVSRSMIGGTWIGSKNICEFKCEDPREAAVVLKHGSIQLTKFKITEVMHNRQIRGPPDSCQTDLR